MVWREGVGRMGSFRGQARQLSRVQLNMPINSAQLAQRQSCLLIVDGHAYAYRAFHALARLNAPDGAPTNAIYGFIKALARMRDRLHPGYVAVFWDGGLAEERVAVLPEYKSQRPPMPEDLRVQFDGINAYLDAAGVAWFRQDATEADDGIATLSRWAVAQGLDVVIASADKDFMQLVSPRVGLLNPNDKSEAIWREEQVRGKAGVAPEQIADWLSLVGDSVDNIPGVPGVGPKTAAELLQQFGSVETLYQRLGEVKSERLRGALQTAAAAVRRNQQLIRLRDALPMEFQLERLRPGAGEAARLADLFRRWGFQTLLAQLQAEPSRQGELL